MAKIPPNAIKNAVMAAGIAATFIAGWEGMKYVPYLDTGAVPTVCAGHTQSVDMKKIYTKPECYKLLDKDTLVAARAVDRLVDVPLSENQKAALISFVFNVGEGAFAKSTLRRKLNACTALNAPCRVAVAQQFDRWVYDNGVYLRGLERRRKGERDLFLRPDDAPQPVGAVLV